MEICYKMLGAHPGALLQPRDVGWGGRWERASRGGTYVYLWLIHVNVWQKPTNQNSVVNNSPPIKNI